MRDIEGEANFPEPMKSDALVSSKIWPHVCHHGNRCRQFTLVSWAQCHHLGSSSIVDPIAITGDATMLHAIFGIASLGFAILGFFTIAMTNF